MSTNEEKLSVRPDAPQEGGTSRRTFLHRSAIAGAVGAAGLGGLLSFAAPSANAARALAQGSQEEERDGLRKRDTNILIAAEIAEALAVTTYTHIINTAPFF